MLCGLAGVSCLAAETGNAPRAVRVMTFNVRYGTADDGINHWDRRKEFLVETIRAFDPDLLGTQEPLAFQRDYLAAALPGHAAWGAGREDGLEKGEMTLLFYRRDRFEKLAGGFFWLSDTPEQPGSRSWDSALPRMVAWVRLRDLAAPDLPPILFLNTHFDHKGVEARRQSARLLRKRIEELGEGCRVVLTGDFNEGEGSAPYRDLFGALDGAASPVLDAFREAHPRRTGEEGTFSGFRADATQGGRIDWIGASRDWMILDAAIDRAQREGRTPSDHFPVRARLAPREL
jgi:endonuclease/exonuclease/phosphatase family metal-dependent hydrolase